MEGISGEKISELLNSPDLMNNLQSILGQFTGGGEQKADIVVPDKSESSALADLSGIADLLGGNNFISSISSFLSQNKTERIALLSALRPFLSEDKQVTLDSILKILKTANIFLAANMFT